jgi:deoxyribodipyrimidine photo-lyase
LTDPSHPRPRVHIVWFKRDLRVADHVPLERAASHGPVVPLYVVEPELWQQPDASGRQWAFVAECLDELRAALAELGQPLVVRVGAVTDVLEGFQRSHGVAALWSHQETGNGWTFKRDRRVAAWCRSASIPWHEEPHTGVVRRLRSRDGWAARWQRFMDLPVATPPTALKPVAGLEPGNIPTAREIGIENDPTPERQKGGRSAGLERRDSFLNRRGASYRTAMSSPLTGASACSRLSPYLAWGALSLREVVQPLRRRQRELREAPKGSTGSWPSAMSSFSARLSWRSHFMQKLEDEPRLEFESMHPACVGLRPAEPDAERLRAWQQGETGLPFVDACMRSLAATGWLNFRMRAMLMAVSSYHLWLDWRRPGEHLARLFTDYEPGIHWPQVQMQSGTTGINATRIYNPVKQGYDQDPDGAFVRRWVPELAPVPDLFLHEPWRWDRAACVLDKHYPFPVVDHLAAAREARERIWSVRRSTEFRAEATRIVDKHGSRKGRARRQQRKVEPTAALFPGSDRRSG